MTSSLNTYYFLLYSPQKQFLSNNSAKSNFLFVEWFDHYLTLYVYS